MKWIKVYLLVWLNAFVWVITYDNIKENPFLLTVSLFTSIISIIYILFILKKITI